jgi:hypothetical protein
MGDVHLGTLACNEEKLKEMLTYIQEKENCYWIDVGDKIEAINYSDPRFDMNTLPKWLWDNTDRNCLAQLQAQKYVNYVKSIGDKCLGMCMGNHEDKAYRRYHYNIHHYICTALGVPDLGWASVLQLKFAREYGKKSLKPSLTFKIALEHGYSGARTKAGKLNVLERCADKYQGVNAVVQGHGHVKIASEKIYLTTTNSGDPRVKQLKVLLVQVPSFFQTYSDKVITYSEMKSYSPASIGALKLIIKPFAKRNENKKTVDYMDYHVSE